MADRGDWSDSPLFRTKPRDPARIDQILAQVAEAWHRTPNLRLLQLLVATIDHAPNPLFNVEDDVLAERLAHLLETGTFPSTPT